MDILDWLVEDHGNLRRELGEIRQDLFHPQVRDRMKLFISKYEAHESVEEEILFPSIETVMNESLKDSSIENWEKVHESIWELLDTMMDSLISADLQYIQRTFFTFTAAVEAHFAFEERVLFPIIRQRVDAKVLRDLEKKVQDRLQRFSLK